MNPVRAFLAAIEPLRAVPTPVLCTRGHYRARISGTEAALLGDPALRAGGIDCRAKGCPARAYPLHTYGEEVAW